MEDFFEQNAIYIVTIVIYIFTYSELPNLKKWQDLYWYPKVMTVLTFIGAILMTIVSIAYTFHSKN